MRRYHHYGIPTQDKRDDESLVEAQGLKFMDWLVGFLQGVLNNCPILLKSAKHRSHSNSHLRQVKAPYRSKKLGRPSSKGLPYWFIVYLDKIKIPGNDFCRSLASRSTTDEPHDAFFCSVFIVFPISQ